jgi:transposase
MSNLSNDPVVLKAIIASLEAENAKLSATLRAHDLLVQTLRTRIAKLQKQAFGKSSEKIEREIEQLELALEDLQVAMAEADEAAGSDDDGEDDAATPSADTSEEKLPRRRPRISKDAPRERRELDPGDSCPDCGGDLRTLGSDAGGGRIVR